jgi:hypothetical protein
MSKSNTFTHECYMEVVTTMDALESGTLRPVRRGPRQAKRPGSQ